MMGRWTELLAFWRRRLNWRNGLLAAGLLGGLSAGGLGLGLGGAVERFRIEGEQSRFGLWVLMQARVEAERMATALTRASLQDSPEAREELALRLELLWGRIQQLTGDAEQRDLSGLRRLHEAMPTMLRLMREIEDGLNARGGDPARVLSLIRTLEQPLQDSATEMNGMRQDYAREELLAIASRLRLLILGFFLLLGSAGALVWMLALAGRRARRAQRAAERAGHEAHQASDTLRALVDGVPAMISTFDADRRFTFGNRALQDFSGRTEAQLLGRRPSDAGLSADIEHDVAQVLMTGRPIAPLEREATDRFGHPRCLLTTTIPLFDAQGRVWQVLRTGLDVTQRRQAEQRARHLSEHDALTDLPNRMLFNQELARRLRQEPGHLALHLVDIDGFRSVNDTHGQAMGDTMLMAVARRLGGLIRPQDMLARLGGDEFAVLQRLNAEGDGLLLASRIVQSLAQPFQLGEIAIRSGASLGLAILGEGEGSGVSPETMMARADLALTTARRAGRGRYMAFSPDMEGEALARRRLQGELAAALAGGHLHLAYQPKFCLEDRRVVGVEALIRWNHPERGAISPGEFVPLAEEAGLALPMAAFVLRSAARQAMEWRGQGLELPVAVNLSGELIGLSEALELVRSVLAESGLPSSLLEVEVTESTFIGDSEGARQMLLSLREMGVRVALDDFGTGFSSLNYLQMLPIDVLKVDRSFVRDLESSAASGRIVDTVVRLAHGLGARVVAEGVETEGQMLALRKLGCDMVQGFLLARPQPAEAIPGLIAAKHQESMPLSA
ncbi:GGDEF and EAL domain-containing protein [Rhodovarius crocodyli]|uniref:GGDEF and EAL domain-containing protein n=1 Tax=Rhodovarius crocodyli TaxID=1979269 RepID=A0A437MHG2_9PROT|nr:GGDEF and EAL domain-containing protein [Rhodovarius crocodyli]RVT97076.1 GGDEF and EAL domain-containing protein [Rhodovarius crocodyli]